MSWSLKLLAKLIRAISWLACTITFHKQCGDISGGYQCVLWRGHLCEHIGVPLNLPPQEIPQHNFQFQHRNEADERFVHALLDDLFTHPQARSVVTAESPDGRTRITTIVMANGEVIRIDEAITYLDTTQEPTHDWAQEGF